MLHVLLTILKVIGIILLVILALLILLAAAVLFVPLRYRIRVRKEDGPLQAEARVTWLLRLICAEAEYLEKQVTVVLKVCGFRLKTMRFPQGAGHAPAEKRSPDGDEDTALQGTGAPKTTPGVPEQSGDVKAPAEPVKTESAQPPADPVKTESAQPPAGPVKTESAQPPAGPMKTEHERTPEEPAGKNASADHQEASESAGPSGLRRVLASLPEHVLQLIEKICGLLLRLLDLPLEAYDRADDIIYRTENKIRDIRRKIDPFFSVEAEHVLGKLIEYVKYLIRGWKPRSAEGYLEFGTGSPDQTGKLTGLLFMILPARAKRYRVEPDFYEKRLRTDTTLQGRIRLYRAAVVGLKLLLDREFRVLIGRIRGKRPQHRR